MVKVLVVDDYQEHIDTLVSTLNMYGSAAEGTKDATAALKKCTGDFPPNLVIIEGLKEGARAWKFTHELLSSNPVMRPYIVCLTGFGSVLQRRLCEECGCDEYVTKPIELSTLLGWVAKARERAERQEAR